MAQTTLHCDSIGDLDSGAAREVINKAIDTAVADLDDRGKDGKPRKVAITLELSQADNGMIVGHVEVKTASPAYRTAGTVAKIKGGAHPELAFQQYAPEHPDQRTIDETERR